MLTSCTAMLNTFSSVRPNKPSGLHDELLKRPARSPEASARQRNHHHPVVVSKLGLMVATSNCWPHAKAPKTRPMSFVMALLTRRRRNPRRLVVGRFFRTVDYDNFYLTLAGLHPQTKLVRHARQ